MLGSLAQCEFSMGKTLLVYNMNLQEMENYEAIYGDIGMFLPLCHPLNKCLQNSNILKHVSSNLEKSITSAHEKIGECKKEILRAKRIRKNRQGKATSGYGLFCVFITNLRVYIINFIVCRVWCFGQGYQATSRQTWDLKVSLLKNNGQTCLFIKIEYQVCLFVLHLESLISKYLKCLDLAARIHGLYMRHGLISFSMIVFFSADSLRLWTKSFNNFHKSKRMWWTR